MPLYHLSHLLIKSSDLHFLFSGGAGAGRVQIAALQGVYVVKIYLKHKNTSMIKDNGLGGL